MKEWERQVMCLLLQRLLDKNLLTQDIHDKARNKILDTWYKDTYFCYADGDGKGEFGEYTQNPC